MLLQRCSSALQMSEPVGPLDGPAQGDEDDAKDGAADGAMADGFSHVDGVLLVRGQGTHFTSDFGEREQLYVSRLRRTFRIAAIVSDTELH